ncbi:hypothetical protein OUZ56_007180 [Daphnia magna]|uniref:Uncharacterized protein n=1 Tax=Daphnia magna TaxID=35525 RepID=A0ABQ9YZ32_9CRUS|nr:hypothetical protein OUZ56_007180 [Daphnia magna]
MIKNVMNYNQKVEKASRKTTLNFGNSSQSLQRVCDKCTNQEIRLKTSTANHNSDKGNEQSRRYQKN